jgi:CBS domain-containing protein
MTQTVADVMTTDPRALDVTSSVEEAARAMREEGIGDVIVCDDGAVCGIVTDRDIVVRVVAEGRGPGSVRLGEMCSSDLAAVTGDTPVGEAVTLMRDRALRRLPVVDGRRPVGIVSLGDLAAERDPESALADISVAPPNT